MTLTKQQIRSYKQRFPDPLIRKKYLPFLHMQGQARFRGEAWTLTFAEFLELWTEDLWQQRGRSTNSLCLSRKDQQGAWNKDNVEICVRQIMLKKKTKVK